MEFLIGLFKALSPPVAAAGILYLAVTRWLETRLTSSIKHEYDTRLEELKKDHAEALKKLEHELLRQTEEFKANLQHGNALAQVRFTKSYELLVMAIGEIYEKLRAYKEAVAVHADPYENGSVTEDEASQKAREFEECFLPREIILDLDLAERVRALSAQLARVKQITDHAPSGDKKSPEWARVRQEMASAKKSFSQVFSAFQELVGIDQRPTKLDGASPPLPDEGD